MMSEAGNRQSLFQELVYARQELMRSMLFLSEKEATSISLHPGWVVRDVVSHITAGECTVLAAVKHLAEEGDPGFRDPVDERQFNVNAVQRRRDLSLGEVVDEMEGVRRQLFHHVRRMHNRELHIEFPLGASGQAQSIAGALVTLCAHDYEHAAHIWQWRAANDLLHRKRFRNVVTSARQDFMNALGGLYEEDMLHMEVCGHWTVRDVMCHVYSWDEEALRTAEHWTGERPWQDGELYDDEWNEVEILKRAGMNIVDLADGLATYHRRWVQFFDRLSNEELAAMGLAPWGEQLALISFFYEMAGHDAVHTPDLRALQANLRRY